jgi:hypothetical protein
MEGFLVSLGFVYKRQTIPHVNRDENTHILPHHRSTKHIYLIVTELRGSIKATVQQNLLLEDELTQEVTEETAQQTLTIETTSLNKICNPSLILICQRLFIAIPRDWNHFPDQWKRR